MNKYICPVCDINLGLWNFVVTANSFQDAEDKIMAEIINNVNSDLDDRLHWIDFIKQADQKDIIIGEIQDIEEL